MWRGTLLTVLLTLALASAAPAQEDEDAGPTPTPTPAPLTDGCDRGPGTDADYADCEPDRRCDPDSTDADYAYGGCCRDVDGTDADYVYGCPLASGEPNSGPPEAPPSPPAPRAAVQALGAQPTLPMTGSETVGIALAGIGLLLAGAGLRLRTRVVP